MYKWYQVQDLDEKVDENLKDLDENLAWLTQKTEDLKDIKGTLLPPPPSDSILRRLYPPPFNKGGSDYANSPAYLFS